VQSERRPGPGRVERTGLKRQNSPPDLIRLSEFTDRVVWVVRFAFSGVVLCALLVGGCGGDDAEVVATATSAPTTTTVTGGETPLAAVTDWLDALSIARYGAADVMVVEEQFVLLLAVESFSPELYAELVSGGISPAVSRTFWESFASGVRGFTGAAITEVDVVGEQRFEAHGRDFAEVEATSPRGDLTIIAQMDQGGRWHVDLLATFGSSFAPLFNTWIERLPGDVIDPLEALARQRSSLQVARDRAERRRADEAVADLERLLEQLI